MPDRRPLILINGSLYVLPVGDDLVTHRPLVLEGGELKQLDAVENPRDHAVLVYIDENQGIQEWNGFDILIGVVNPTDFNVHDIQTNMIAGIPEGQLACSELQTLIVAGAHATTFVVSELATGIITGAHSAAIVVQNLDGATIPGINSQVFSASVVEGNVILET